MNYDPSAKPFKGILIDVYELREGHEGNAYKTVYLVKLEEKIYVLYGLQEKAMCGITMLSKEMYLVAQGLKFAIADSQGATLSVRTLHEGLAI